MEDARLLKTSAFCRLVYEKRENTVHLPTCDAQGYSVDRKRISALPYMREVNNFWGE